MSSTEVTTVREALWGLSNITASTPAHVAAFFDESQLLDRVLTLADHSNRDIRKEALFTLCNAVTEADP